MPLIRVLEIPKHSGNFLFGGGEPQTWVEVDWFRDDGLGPLMSVPADWPAFKLHIKGKKYFDEAKAYLVLHESGSFTIGYKAP